MTDQFHRILMRVQKPARYVGGEYNQIIKDKKDVDVRVAFCFPDTYETVCPTLACGFSTA